MRTFVYRDASSHKFWSIDVQGAKHVIRFGKFGANGQTQEKTFPSAELAAAAAEKLVREKTGKGYAEQLAAAAAPPPSPERQALEAALVANPDDLAAHAAYADYLTEQGDPRGEFVQVQLALEDPSLKPAERKKLQATEAKLLKQYAATWLGDAGRFLVGAWSGPDKPIGVTFARGWPDEVRLLPVPEPAVRVVASSPEFRLLRKLDVVYDMKYHAFDFDQFTDGPTKALRAGEDGGEVYDATGTLSDLAKSPYLTNLRALRYGFSDADEDGRPMYSTMVDPFGRATAKQVIELLGRCPRLEELYLNVDVEKVQVLFGSPALGQLRLFQYYFGMDANYQDGGSGYPLAALAKNPALTKLETLRLHPGRETMIERDPFEALVESPHLLGLRHLHVHMTQFEEQSYQLIAESELLGRLKTLDLAYGGMTDAGAYALAAGPDLRRLDALDVSWNTLSSAGVQALKATGVRVAAGHQHTGDDDYNEAYDVDAE